MSARASSAQKKQYNQVVSHILITYGHTVLHPPHISSCLQTNMTSTTQSQIHYEDIVYVCIDSSVTSILQATFICKASSKCCQKLQRRCLSTATKILCMNSGFLSCRPFSGLAKASSKIFHYVHYDLPKHS